MCVVTNRHVFYLNWIMTIARDIVWIEKNWKVVKSGNRGRHTIADTRCPGKRRLFGFRPRYLRYFACVGISMVVFQQISGQLSIAFPRILVAAKEECQVQLSLTETAAIICATYRCTLSPWMRLRPRIKAICVTMYPTSIQRFLYLPEPRQCLVCGESPLSTFFVSSPCL